MSPLGSLLGRRSARQHLGGACRLQAQAGKGRALHVMLFFENFIRALLICNELRSRYYQRALLVYHYPSIKTTDLGVPVQSMQKVPISLLCKINGLTGCAICFSKEISGVLRLSSNISVCAFRLC